MRFLPRPFGRQLLVIASNHQLSPGDGQVSSETPEMNNEAPRSLIFSMVISLGLWAMTASSLLLFLLSGHWASETVPWE